MPGEFYELLRRAIVERRQVVAVYDGLRRELCPHRLGTKNGRLQCLFYQFRCADPEWGLAFGSELRQAGIMLGYGGCRGGRITRRRFR